MALVWTLAVSFFKILVLIINWLGFDLNMEIDFILFFWVFFLSEPLLPSHIDSSIMQEALVSENNIYNSVRQRFTWGWQLGTTLVCFLLPRVCFYVVLKVLETPSVKHLLWKFPSLSLFSLFYFSLKFSPQDHVLSRLNLYSRHTGRLPSVGWLFFYLLLH